MESTWSPHGVYMEYTWRLHVSPWSLHGVHGASTEYTRSIHGVYTEWARSTHRVYTEYTRSIHGVYTEYTRSGQGLHGVGTEWARTPWSPQGRVGECQLHIVWYLSFPLLQGHSLLSNSSV